MRIELIPSAKRLIRSLRDIGYEFVDSVADIVDNSLEAESSQIKITLKFDGEDSYLIIADNGVGMASKEIQEALRFGSNRSYDKSDDLGRYGLGLKTASLSQCERLTVSARRGEERVRINSYCWDLDHIEQTNRWEILKIDSNNIKKEAVDHLSRTTGTVITWERLGRLLGYKFPSGEYARRQSEQMVEALKLHLGMVFHQFLSGEVTGKRIAIYINDEKVSPWDPYSRGEINTKKLDQIMIPLDFNHCTYNVRLQPYILPPQSLYSSPKAHLHASGPGRWNRQQGLYIYRSNRIIQAGGWSGLRTSDEHTKLVRIAMFIPSQLEELFQVNVAKKHATLPRELKVILHEIIAPIVQRAQEVYREKIAGQAISIEKIQSQSRGDLFIKHNPKQKELESHAELIRLIEAVTKNAKLTTDKPKVTTFLENMFASGSEDEKRVFKSMLGKYMALEEAYIK